VSWRAGIDLNPLDVADGDQMRWLETLVWPEHDHRRARLRAAVDLARVDPPRMLRADLNDALPQLVAEAPAEATLVVFHSAVLTYLAPSERARFVAQVEVLPGHWVSNEGPRVLPKVAAAAGRPAAYPGEAFLLALDGEPKAWTGPHGQFLDWL
jgi:hypothetical protein